MSLAPGLRVGPYEVTEPIGRGGMGEVYRARDTKLGRDVAIKVLPTELALDSERVARFEREAKLLASLNHPNIASIHGFEEADGVKALVLELVEGSTLAERVAHGPLSVAEAVAIASQITDALEAGHEASIIHRDLKPLNIKITEDGTVKLLDYGLAKVLEREASAHEPSELSQSPTLTRHGTEMGVILGTAAYMSPEQAKGKPVDKRADIWAFGAVLYEMLTGRLAFAGEDVSDTLARVLTQEPEWEALPAETPDALRQVLRICLTKNPKARARDIADVRLALTGGFWTGAGADATYASVARPKPSFLRRALPALTAAAGVAMGLALSSLTRPELPEPRVTRTSIVLPDTQTRTNTGRRGIAVSPTGEHVVYVANGQLYLRALVAVRAEPLAGTEGTFPTVPFFSPDGQWIGFHSTRDGQLRRIAVAGGATVTICETTNPFGASWGPDDVILYALGSRGVFRVPASGGTPELLIEVEVEKGERAHGPSILPDGRTVLFTFTRGTWDEASIVAESLTSHERKVLVEGGTDARYLPTGHLVYAFEGNLLVAPFDPDRLEVVGGAVPLVEAVSSASVTAGWNFDVSRDGTLAYFPGGPDAARTLVWVDRNGREEPIPAEPRAYAMARISPDGTRAVVEIEDSGQDLWVWDFGRETLARLTFAPGGDRYPLWMPDGRSVIYTSGLGPVRNLHRKPVDGTGDAQRLSESPYLQDPMAVTPDGAQIVFRNFTVLVGEDDRDLEILRLGDDEPVIVPLLDEDYDFYDARLSPDGRWLAYESDESGVNEIFVRPFPNTGGGSWQISSGGGTRPLWGPDGRELFYVPVGNQLSRVVIETDPEFHAGLPEPLLDVSPYHTNLFARSFDISPDGRRFLFIKKAETSAETAIIMVQNWFEEVKRRVPSP